MPCTKFNRMNNLQHYDNAAHKFYSARHLTSLPLCAWDYYAQHFSTLLKSASDISILKKLAADFKWNTALQIEEELLQKNHVLVVTDAQLRIVHASHNMKAMNGYSSKEVLGMTPKMFQGVGTCRSTNKQISKAIKAELPFEATVLNYRKDGSSYKCWIKAQPIFNAENEVVHFIAYEKEVA